MICVDASLAVKWVLDEERSDQARALFRALERAGRDIVAPPLLPFEVTNILRQRTRATNGISLDAATELLDRFLGLPIAIFDPDDLHRRALALAHAFDLPAAYDAHYLALAEHLGCELWTDDGRLLRRVEHDLSFVRRLGDYPVPAEG
jgi:predicted nucleic acid-binding protein